MSHSRLRTPRRGYLANVLTIPPLVYPFQYNPAQLTDSKRVEWVTRTPPPEDAAGGGPAASGFAAAAQALGGVTEFAARTLSGAQPKQFGTQGERTLAFQFQIDGREHRPGEPPRRRNPDGDILADLALLRSFVYPQAADWGDLVATWAAGGSLTAQIFNAPPTALLVLGDTTIEGFVSELRIGETQFNERLDPVRADVDVTIVEKTDSLAFVVDALKRIARTALYTSYEDLPRVIG